MPPDIVTVCRKAHFNAAHRLYNPNWDDDRNEKVFGKCNNPNYHGHNYDLIVKVTGEVDPETGYVIDMKVLNDLINEKIIDRFDHRNLILDLEDFRDQNPSAENIAIRIWHLLRPRIDSKLVMEVVLFETERNFVEYKGPVKS